MRAVFDYSWEMLSSAECQVLAKLSVFRRGCDLEAAQYVTGASLTTLANLVDKSLLRLSATGRYEMHELLRQFAADKLVGSNEVSTMEQRHFDYFCTLAEQLEGGLYGPQYVPTLNRYEIEHDNFRAALDWTVRSGDTTAGLRLAGALGWFWHFRYYFAEGRDWLIKLLAAGHSAPIDVRAKAVHHAIDIIVAIDFLATNADEYRHSLIETALTLIPAVNNTQLKAWLFYSVGMTENLQSERRRECFQDALTLFRQIGDTRGINEMFLLLGQNAFQCGEFARAFVLLNEGIKLARQTGDIHLLAHLTMLTGCAYYYQGIDRQCMKTFYHESLDLFYEQGDMQYPQVVLLGLGKVAFLEQNEAQAQIFYEKSLALGPDVGNSSVTVSSLVGMARVWCAQGKPAQAARLLGAVEDRARTLFTGPSILEKDGQTEYEHSLHLVSTQLGEEAFAALLAEGRTMTLQQAVAYALQREATGLNNFVRSAKFPTAESTE
jgi:tetratricopeptide (TPR) repeat protein